MIKTKQVRTYEFYRKQALKGILSNIRLSFQPAALELDRSSLQLKNKAFYHNSQGYDYGKDFPQAIPSEGQMRNRNHRNLACGPTMGKLIGWKARLQTDDFFVYIWESIFNTKTEND